MVINKTVWQSPAWSGAAAVTWAGCPAEGCTVFANFGVIDDDGGGDDDDEKMEVSQSGQAANSGICIEVTPTKCLADNILKIITAKSFKRTKECYRIEKDLFELYLLTQLRRSIVIQPK